MAKKTIKRIHPVGKLMPLEAARDREIRRKVMDEFPPLEREPDSHNLSDPLRESITQSGKSIRRLAKQPRYPKSCCNNS